MTESIADDRITFFTDTRMVVYRGKGVRLAPQEASILLVLANSQGVTVSYDDILMAMYPTPDDEPENAQGVLALRVPKLRRKLEDNGFPRLCIQQISAPTYGRPGATGGYYSLTVPTDVVSGDKVVPLTPTGLDIVRKLVEACPDERLVELARQVFRL